MCLVCVAQALKYQGLLEEAHISIGELQEEVAEANRHISVLSSVDRPNRDEGAVRDKVCVRFTEVVFL